MKNKKNGDVNLKAFKGADSDQKEKEQRETDGFFTQFKSIVIQLS